MANNNNEVEVVFWKIWRNCVLNKVIFIQIRLYNNHFAKRLIKLSTNDLLGSSSSDVDELKDYKYSGYFNKLYVEVCNGTPAELISSRSVFDSFHKLPTNVEEIELYVAHYHKEPEDVIPIIKPIVPPTVTKLSIASNLKVLFGVGAIPSTIKSLKLIHCNYGKFSLETSVPIKGKSSKKSIFPKDGLTSLDIDLIKNQTFTKSILPNTLTKLVLDTLVGCKLKRGSLPNSLTYLLIGSEIKLKPGLLPASLIYLKFNVVSIEVGDLPIGLKHLSFIGDCEFDQEIEPNLFPMGLETIKFENDFNQPLDNLPTSITSLKLGGCFDMISTFNHLTSLIKLKLENGSLIFEPYWYLSQSTTPIISNNDLPSGCLGMIKLLFQQYLLSSPTKSPNNPGLNSLEKLNVHQNCEFVNNNSMPPKVWKLKYPNVKYFKDNNNLKQISLEADNGENFISLEPMWLPNRVEIIKDFVIEGPFSNSLLSHCHHLHTIHFNLLFRDVILPNTFPETITELKFSLIYDQPFSKDSLPSNLKYLSIKGLDKSYKISHFPKSIEILEVFHLNDTPVSGLTFPNLKTLIIWRDTLFENLPINSTLKSIFISNHNSSILDQKGLHLFDEFSSFIKVLDDTNGLDKVFKNKW